MYLMACALNKDSDQPSHLHHMIRMFAGHFVNNPGSKASLVDSKKRLCG